jgi:hypothetical protein
VALGQELGLPVVDTWTLMDGHDPDKFREFLTDGLHFNHRWVGRRLRTVYSLSLVILREQGYTCQMFRNEMGSLWGLRDRLECWLIEAVAAGLAGGTSW